MNDEPRNKRMRWGLGLSLLLLTLAPVASAGAGNESPSSSSQIPTVAEARAEVARSEAAVIAATAARDAARAEVADLDSTSAELVNDIADARADLRRRAAAAFVSGEPDEELLVLFGGDDLYDASAKVRLMTHAAGQSKDAVDHYNVVKRDVDPKVVAAGVHLQQLEQAVIDANDAVLAARATEAEAERQAAERARVERIARAAAAAAATTTTAAPTTTAPPATVAADGALVVAPPTTAAPAPPATAPLPAVPAGGPSEAQWAALRNCESGGNYRAVSASGKYRGAYQFDYRTWAGLGGAGDPAAAPPAEQDARAKVLYSQRGWRPWPVCGRFLR